MTNYEEHSSFVDVHFDVTKEKINLFLQQFAPDYTGYILDQTPKQLHSKEYIVRIYYEKRSSITITCYSAKMLQQRIQNIFNINQEVRFINSNPKVEEHSFCLNRIGKEDTTIYYTATLEFEFIKA